MALFVTAANGTSLDVHQQMNECPYHTIELKLIITEKNHGIVVEIGDAVKYCAELSNSQTLKDKYYILSFTWNSRF